MSSIAFFLQVIRRDENKNKNNLIVSYDTGRPRIHNNTMVFPMDNGICMYLSIETELPMTELLVDDNVPVPFSRAGNNRYVVDQMMFNDLAVLVANVNITKANMVKLYCDADKDAEIVLLTNFRDIPYVNSRIIFDQLKIMPFSYTLETNKTDEKKYEIMFETVLVDKGEYHSMYCINVVAVRCSTETKDRVSFNFHGLELLPSDESIMCYIDTKTKTKTYVFGPIKSIIGCDKDDLDKLVGIPIKPTSEAYFSEPVELVYFR